MKQSVNLLLPGKALVFLLRPGVCVCFGRAGVLVMLGAEFRASPETALLNSFVLKQQRQFPLSKPLSTLPAVLAEPVGLCFLRPVPGVPALPICLLTTGKMGCFKGLCRGKHCPTSAGCFPSANEAHLGCPTGNAGCIWGLLKSLLSVTPKEGLQGWA